ncbi:hypothetical protein B0F90DRAFT_1737723, partial [Multifurca ochricompacta]
DSILYTRIDTGSLCSHVRKCHPLWLPGKINKGCGGIARCWMGQLGLDALGNHLCGLPHTAPT